MQDKALSMIKKLSKRVCALCALSIIAVTIMPLSVFAQATFGTGTSLTDLPVDGGISLLVAAGVGYGIKKLYKSNKSNKENI